MATKGAPTQKAKADPRFVDFDAAFAEDTAAPIPLHLFGRTWDLPGSVPARVLLRLDRLMLAVAHAQETGEVPQDLDVADDLSMELIARSLAGDDAVDQWLELGITYDQLQAVSHYLHAIHRGVPPKEALGEATPPPPNRAQRRATGSRSTRSSSGGQRSRRTGSGSTAKT